MPHNFPFSCFYLTTSWTESPVTGFLHILPFSSCFVSTAPCASSYLVVTVLFLEFWYTIAFFFFAFYSRHFQNMNLIYPSSALKNYQYIANLISFIPHHLLLFPVSSVSIILKLIPDIMLFIISSANISVCILKF